jgi:hypothetical protein
VLPKRIDAWSLTRLQPRLVKTEGRPLKHARYFWLLLAESHLMRRLFGAMLARIAALLLLGRRATVRCRFHGSWRKGWEKCRRYRSKEGFGILQRGETGLFRGP